MPRAEAAQWLPDRLRSVESAPSTIQGLLAKSWLVPVQHPVPKKTQAPDSNAFLAFIGNIHR
jgi:hypothetical protein